MILSVKLTIICLYNCPGFGWARVNFPPISCVLDLVQKEYW